MELDSVQRLVALNRTAFNTKSVCPVVQSHWVLGNKLPTCVYNCVL